MIDVFVNTIEALNLFINAFVNTITCVPGKKKSRKVMLGIAQGLLRLPCTKPPRK